MFVYTYVFILGLARGLGESGAFERNFILKSYKFYLENWQKQHGWHFGLCLVIKVSVFMFFIFLAYVLIYSSFKLILQHVNAWLC